MLLPIATETPEALLNVRSIAAADDRVAAITWGCEDLSAEMGALGTRDVARPEQIPRPALCGAHS